MIESVLLRYGKKLFYFFHDVFNFHAWNFTASIAISIVFFMRLERGAKRVKLEDPLQRQAGDLELSAWLQELEASIHSFHPFQAEREAGWAALLPNDPLGDLECLHVLDFLLLPNFSVELERVQHHCMKPSNRPKFQKRIIPKNHTSDHSQSSKILN